LTTLLSKYHAIYQHFEFTVILIVATACIPVAVNYSDRFKGTTIRQIFGKKAVILPE